MNNFIQQLAEISRFYGQDNQFVIAGGGNTSFKTEEKLWVKASGFSLGTISEEGFAILDRKKLKFISTKTYSNDPLERERQIKDDLSDANLTKDLRPSVETSLHDLIDYSFVVHLHPTIINGLMCSNQASEVTEHIFGKEVLYVPYTDPGYILFKAVEKEIIAFKSQSGICPKIIFLQNHGIFVGADTIQEIKEIYESIIAKIEGFVIKKPDLSATEIPGDITELVPAIRMMLSVADDLKTLKVTKNKLIDRFISDKAGFEKIEFPSTPDLIVYCKSNYLYAEGDTSAEILSGLVKSIPVFIEKFGYSPKVILIKWYGLIAVGDHAKQAQIVTEVFLDMMKIALYAESFGGHHCLTAGQIRFIDTWEVENYRRKISAAGSLKGRVQNRTIIVTGAAMGFGEGIAKGLFSEGANLVIADINPEVGEQTVASINKEAGNNQAVFIKTNVADESLIKKLVKETVCRFGGFDVFVSNAGILRAGGLDEMTIADFDLITKINYSAFFYCTKIAAPVLKLQNKYSSNYYSDIIQINSKSGLRGSNKNFAYAGGKFGGIGLTQSFALELAPFKIKVNAICPGNYYEGPLWSDPEKGLFQQYLRAGKVPGAKTIKDVEAYYLSQVPLGKGCTPVDVVKAVMYLVDQKNETGQAIPISGGQVMLG